MAKQVTVHRGTARNVHWHDSPTRSKVLSFRLEVTDMDGNPDTQIPVELDLMDVVDILVDSDEVEVTGTMQSNGILRPSLIRNMQTGATIEGGKRKGAKYLIALLLPFLLGGAGLILSKGDPRGGAAGGMITGALIGCGLCMILWIVMAIIDNHRAV